MGGGGIWAVIDWVLKATTAVRRKGSRASPIGLAARREQAKPDACGADGKTTLVSKNPSLRGGRRPVELLGKTVNDASGGGKMVITQDPRRMRASRASCATTCLRGGRCNKSLSPVGALMWPCVGCTPRGAGGTRWNRSNWRSPRATKRATCRATGTKVTPTPGKWKLVVVGAQNPREDPATGTVKTLYLIPIVEQLPAGNVYVDEVSLHRVE